MSTLTDAYNPDYSKKASILTGISARVTVDLEGSEDVGFWRNILEELCPLTEFHYNPYYTVQKDTDLKKRVEGKARIMKIADQMNGNHIGCIDSDYDWLLSDYCGNGKSINDNKYLLQTYTYSFENLLCAASTLNDFCQDVTEENWQTDVSEYVREVSAIIYLLLVWSAYLCSKGNHEFTPTSWRDILVSTLKDAKASLALIKERTKTKLDEIEASYASEKAKCDEMKASLSKEKNVTEDSAYLFVRGHDLYDHLVYGILGPVISALRKQHYDGINASDRDKDSCNVALREYSKKCGPVKAMLCKNYRYKGQTYIYNLIRQDVHNVWE